MNTFTPDPDYFPLNLPSLRFFKQKDISKLSDEELVVRYRESGRNELVGELYKRYTHLIFGLCLKYFKNEADARDMVMQIFEKLMVDLKDYKVDFFKGWIYSVSRNACLMELRKQKTQLGRKQDIEREETSRMESTESAHLTIEDFEEQGDPHEARLQQLETAIENLNEQQKLCIGLFYLKKHSYAEVAEMTGLTIKQVKSHLQNGKRNLKIELLKADGRE